MKRARTIGLVAIAAAVALPALVGRVAAATEPPPPPSPPPGWEAAPPPPSAALSSSKKPKLRAAACCAYDETCCIRQASINMSGPALVARAVDARMADIPALVVKKALKDGPGVEGAPPLLIIDGRGGPPPWPNGPHIEVRVLPTGRFGRIQWRDSESPFFADPEYRGMGYGVRHDLHPSAADKGRSDLTGSVSYTAFSQAEGDKITVDLVEGALKGTPALRVAAWARVAAVPLADGFLHVYRGEQEDGPRVTFVLPEVIRAFESKDTKLDGGFFPSRFSSAEAYTTYTMPAAPERSGVAIFQLLDSQVNRWFRRPRGSAKPERSVTGVVSTSQTSAEAEPHVRVLVLGPTPADGFGR